MAHKLHGRKTPYTEIGIKRIPCFRCGKPAAFQWQVCADNRLYRPICADCDIELNRLVLEWMNYPNVEIVLSLYESSVQ